MAIVSPIINLKGGTGKTTTTVNLGACLARKGYKVLLIDFDQQCNLGSSLGLFNTEKHIGQVLLGQVPWFEAIQEVEGLHIIPANIDLNIYEKHIMSEAGGEHMLKEVLANVEENYDYILIDCGPTLDGLAINALVAADYYLVPMQAEHLPFIGLDRLIDTEAKVRRRMNPNLQLGGILFVQYDRKTKFGQAIADKIQSNEEMRQKLLNATIRQDISLMEASALGMSVFEYAPESRGAADYLELTNEIINRYGKEIR